MGPESYILPNDTEELKEAMESSSEDDWFIYKPALAARGEKIQLIHYISDIEDLTVSAVV